MHLKYDDFGLRFKKVDLSNCVVNSYIGHYFFTTPKVKMITSHCVKHVTEGLKHAMM